MRNGDACVIHAAHIRRAVVQTMRRSSKGPNMANVAQLIPLRRYNAKPPEARAHLYERPLERRRLTRTTLAGAPFALLIEAVEAQKSR